MERSYLRILVLSQEDHLGEGMAIHSKFSYLETPIDRGAWQAIVHRVTKSWTRLKRLSTAHSQYQYLNSLP